MRSLFEIPANVAGSIIVDNLPRNAIRMVIQVERKAVAAGGKNKNIGPISETFVERDIQLEQCPHFYLPTFGQSAPRFHNKAYFCALQIQLIAFCR